VGATEASRVSPCTALRQHFRADQGRKGARAEKLRLLGGMANPERRAKFVAVYVKLLTEVLGGPGVSIIESVHID
jgi:hypothetical protein